MYKKLILPYTERAIEKIWLISNRQIPKDEIVRKCLLEMRTCVPFNAASFFFFEPNTFHISGVVLENIDFKYLVPLVRGVQEINQNVQIKNPSTRGSDISSLTPKLGLILKEKVLKPNRLSHSLIGTVCSPTGDCHGQYWLWRSIGRPNFSGQDLSTAGEISSILGNLPPFNPDDQDPPIETLVEIVQNRSCPGTVVVDANEKVLFLNQEGRNYLELINPASRTDIDNGVRSNKALSEICRSLREKIFQQKNQGEQTLKISQIYAFGGVKFCLTGTILENGLNRGDHRILILIDHVSKDKLKINKVLENLHLTLREVATVKLLLLGKTNKEIAQSLDISAHTVKDHIRNIMFKLRTSTRTGIISRIIKVITSPHKSTL